jgi:energy-coupling factor transporter transmembrane protein EcfT
MNDQGYVVNPSMTNKKNTVGLVGFIMSIVSFVLCGTMSFVALILSIIGICNAKKCNGDAMGLSVAGLIISILTSVIKFVMLILFIIPLIFVPSIIEEIDENGDFEINYNNDYNSNGSTNGYHYNGYDGSNYNYNNRR